MEHHKRTEAERLLGIAEKLLQNKDLSGCKDFAILAREKEPSLESADQVIAVSEVLLAGDRRVNNQNDWYSILQVAPQQTYDVELVKKQYRRLVLLLHPDKNKLPFADSAFRLVVDAWNIVSDSNKKALYDKELGLFTKVELGSRKKQFKADNFGQKSTVRRNSRGRRRGVSSIADAGAGAEADATPKLDDNNKRENQNPTASPTFWTACPYCYNLYEYSRVYEDCCLRCDSASCKKSFTASEISALPPIVPGQEAYYCCWGFFPMGFVTGNDELQKRTPSIFDGGDTVTTKVKEVRVRKPRAQTASKDLPAGATNSTEVKKKRGRPKKIQTGIDGGGNVTVEVKELHVSEPLAQPKSTHVPVGESTLTQPKSTYVPVGETGLTQPKSTYVPVGETALTQPKSTYVPVGETASTEVKRKRGRPKKIKAG